MKVHLKLTSSLLRGIQSDLRRPHPVAFERVGFVACRGGWTDDGGVVLIARQFLPVDDVEYAEDEHVGARITAQAIRLALQHAYREPDCMLFVHEHAHTGEPRPSRVDSDCWRELVPNFWHVRPSLPHGALILSEDSAFGMLWVPGVQQPALITDFTIVSWPLQRWTSGASR